MIFYVDNKLKGKTVEVFDTTLRDGEQTAGISFDENEKMVIARQLDKLGVDIIEAGMPINSKPEANIVREISREGLTSRVCGLARMLIPDVDACLESEVDMVHVFIQTSEIQRKATVKKSQDGLLDMSREVVQYVKDHGRECMFSAMDANRGRFSTILRP